MSSPGPSGEVSRQSPRGFGTQAAFGDLLTLETRINHHCLLLAKLKRAHEDLPARVSETASPLLCPRGTASVECEPTPSAPMTGSGNESLVQEGQGPAHIVGAAVGYSNAGACAPAMSGSSHVVADTVAETDPESAQSEDGSSSPQATPASMVEPASRLAKHRTESLGKS